MKTKQIVFTFLLIFSSLAYSYAQKGNVSAIRLEKLTVQGACGMCKNKIEKASIKEGATTASWDEKSHTLSVSYNRYKTNALKIQQAIAAAGYDTKDVSADEAAYSKLPMCCHYERVAAVVVKASTNCCSTEMACSAGSSCCKEGKCDTASKRCKDIAACKENGCCKS